MHPLPWSHSRLEDFKNCPRAFAEKQVYKSVVEEQNEASIWGNRVHKHFEERLTSGVVLPPELEIHEPYLQRLYGMPGQMFVEERVALNRKAEPCGFFDEDVWFRGVIDFMKIFNGHATIIDHKTGKHHSKFGQLRLFALHTFIAHPEVGSARADYYWTQTMTKTGEGYARSQVPQLWAPFLPDLKQYAQAFKEELWQPRPSGLCNGWCPVLDCEHWKPKRRKG